MSTIWERARDSAWKRFDEIDTWADEHAASDAEIDAWLNEHAPESLKQRAEAEAARRWDTRSRTVADARQAAERRLEAGELS